MSRGTALDIQVAQDRVGRKSLHEEGLLQKDKGVQLWTSDGWNERTNEEQLNI